MMAMASSKPVIALAPPQTVAAETRQNICGDWGTASGEDPHNPVLPAAETCAGQSARCGMAVHRPCWPEIGLGHGVVIWPIQEPFRGLQHHINGAFLPLAQGSMLLFVVVFHAPTHLRDVLIMHEHEVIQEPLAASPGQRPAAAHTVWGRQSA